MRILIAPDKFKGSLSALEAAQAIARGFRAAMPEAVCTMAPIADGGEGFAEALVSALQAEWIEVDSVDPIGRPIRARYGWVERQKLALMEMSEASGLWRLSPGEYSPLTANTEGTGRLFLHALQRGAQKIVMGLGGSATTDGGAGFVAALGYRFFDKDGKQLAPSPADLAEIARVERPQNLQFPEIIIACDVNNPLLGERGAAPVYGPQKGANAAQVKYLEAMLARLAECAGKSSGENFSQVPGAGAAGGLGFGLMTFCGGKIRSGFEVVADLLNLRERIAASDLVITGEGRLDDQTLEGKGPAGVALLARECGKRVIAFGGSVLPVVKNSTVFDEVIAIVDSSVPLEQAMKEAASLLETVAAEVARRISAEAK